MADPRRGKGRVFTPQQDAQIRRLRLAGMTFREIGAAIGVPLKAAERRHTELTGQRRDYEKRSREGDTAATSVTVSAEAQADAAFRARLMPASLTAAVLGDPLPGYSALDQKRAGA